MSDVDRDHSPRFAAAFGEVMYWLEKLYFRYRFRGAERLPAGPCLIVGNHSGIGIPDVLCLMGVAHRVRPGRRVVGMMHDIFVSLPIIGHVSRAFGAVRAHPDAAKEAFACGYDVIVFPGGNIDSCRPFYRARAVEFGARRGYLRIALACGVPIVPLVTWGSHYGYLLLPLGDGLGRWLKRRGWMRDERLPVPIASFALAAVIAAAAAKLVAPWWIGVALAALLLPNPVRITSELLEPIDVAAATAHIGDPAERVEAGHRLVLRRLEAALALMRHDRPLDLAAVEAAVTAPSDSPRPSR